MDVGSLDAVLEPGPGGFEGDGTHVAAHPFVGQVIDGPGTVAVKRELGIGLDFVGADPRPGS